MVVYAYCDDFFSLIRQVKLGTFRSYLVSIDNAVDKLELFYKH